MSQALHFFLFLSMTTTVMTTMVVDGMKNTLFLFEDFQSPFLSISFFCKFPSHLFSSKTSIIKKSESVVWKECGEQEGESSSSLSYIHIPLHTLNFNREIDYKQPLSCEKEGSESMWINFRSKIQKKEWSLSRVSTENNLWVKWNEVKGVWDSIESRTSWWRYFSWRRRVLLDVEHLSMCNQTSMPIVSSW